MMADVTSLTISEIEKRLTEGAVSEEFLAACREDKRRGVERLWRKFQREADERERVDSLYQFFMQNLASKAKVEVLNTNVVDRVNL